MEENAKAPYMKAALIYGAIFGVLSVVVSVVFELLGVSFETWADILKKIISIAIITYCLYAYRNEYLSGYANFGKLFSMSIFIGVVSGAIIAVYAYINITIIDPEAIEKMSNLMYEKLLNNPKIPEEMLDDMLEKIEGRLTIGRIVIGSFISIIIGTILVGLVASAILKKEQSGPADNVA